jgi:hypothetical protein
MVTVFDYEQLRAAATVLGWQVEMVSAVSKKEVLANPFFVASGKKLQKILYERHVFWRNLVKKGVDPAELLRRDPSLRDILGKTPYPTSGYGKYIAQYQRRERAAGICHESAFAACSYSGFQILGENWRECGYDSVDAFVEAMDTPANWLTALVALVKSKGIEATLRPDRLDFAEFSEKWNGPDYWRVKYDVELSRIYQRELAASLPKHDSRLAALAQSQTVQRTVGTVAAGTVPGAGVLLQSDSVAQLLDTAKTIAGKGQEISGQVAELQTQAAAVAGQLDWLPWAVGGQTALLVLLGVAVGWRYLHDRGY